ncbi:MAG TPA: hypothetical protein VF812_18645 [Ktedonobacterales bacterium]
MLGSLPLNLILSLVFGLGQVIVGAWLAYRPLVRRRYLQWRVGLLAFVGLWFVSSGLIELLVSGMETSERLGAGPSASTFVAWRAHADSALFIATLLLTAGLLAYLAVLRWRGDTVARRGQRLESAAGIEGERSR